MYIIFLKKSLLIIIDFFFLIFFTHLLCELLFCYILLCALLRTLRYIIRKNIHEYTNILRNFAIIMKYFSLK